MKVNKRKYAVIALSELSVLQKQSIIEHKFGSLMNYIMFTNEYTTLHYFLLNRNHEQREKNAMTLLSKFPLPEKVTIQLPTIYICVLDQSIVLFFSYVSVHWKSLLLLPPTVLQSDKSIVEKYSCYILYAYNSIFYPN